MNIKYGKIGNHTELNEHIASIGNYINTYADELNTLNDSMFTIVDKALGYGQSLTESLKLMANQVQDIIILDGNSAKIVSPFGGVAYKSTNCIVDNESLSIRLSNKNVKRERIWDMAVNVNDRNVKIDKDGVLAGKSSILLSSENIQLTAEIVIDLLDNTSVSDIYLETEDDGTKYPKIIEVLCISDDGAIASPLILNSNAKSYSLASNNVHIRIEPSMCKQIRIKILKDDSELNGSVDVYSIEINKIEIGMSECVDSGNVVIGPIKSESEIIKIGTFFEHGANIKSFASTDAVDWIEISNINTLSDMKSILNINNISEDSISTQTSKEFFIKYELSATSSIPLNESVKYTVRSGTTDDGYIEIPYQEEHMVTGVFQSSTPRYGKPQVYTGKISDISKPFGIMDNTKLSLVGDSSIFNDTSIKIVSDYDKMLIENNNGYTSQDYAGTNISVFTVSSPVLKTVSKNTNINCCIKTKVQADSYTVKIGDNEWVIDLSNGFSRSVDCFNLTCNQGDIVNVYASDARKIGTINAALVNGQYIISLYDTFFEPITDVKFNKYYPYGDVDNTYSISKGKIVAKNSSIYEVLSYVQFDSKIRARLISGSKNKAVILDRKYASKYTQDNIDYAAFKNQAKLDHSNIIPGSLVVDTTTSPIISIDTEVDFIDGKVEFNRYKKSKVTITNQSIRNIFAQGIKDDGDIIITGEADLFINRVFSEEDLVYRGDYLIVEDGILLPLEITTSKYIQTEITFDSVANNSSSGLYSVDYKNGILYSKNKMHKGIKISYLHSSLYASYDAVAKVDSDTYNDTGNSIVVFGSGKSYFVETTPKNVATQYFNVSPLLKDIEIRYTI